MNLHEYQAKILLSKCGVPISGGKVATTPEEAAEAFSPPLSVVKAQIHAGGRGKGGGVKLVKSAEEARAAAEGMLGKPLVTHQTGPEGRVVRKVYVEEGCDIEREYYLGVVIDRKVGMPVLMASTEGGVEIEEVAETSPEKILKEPIDVRTGLEGYQLRRVAFGLGLSGDNFKSFMKMARSLVTAFIENDCSLLEINPLVLRKSGGFLALDAKMGVDDRALARHPEIEEMRDIHEEDPNEYEAAKFGLSYVSMDGNIGCMVNGAGLAMATMDIIQFSGGNPANFLDVGGGATKDQVKVAFKLLLANPKVKAVLINIFGGILQCDVLASGIVAALKEVEVNIPVVVRLEGTNVERGREILANSGLKIESAANMGEAARKAVEAAQ
jgi:succinyl-CoA synthetase beta subunit